MYGRRGYVWYPAPVHQTRTVSHYLAEGSAALIIVQWKECVA